LAARGPPAGKKHNKWGARGDVGFLPRGGQLPEQKNKHRGERVGKKLGGTTRTVLRERRRT